LERAGVVFIGGGFFCFFVIKKNPTRTECKIIEMSQSDNNRLLCEFSKRGQVEQMEEILGEGAQINCVDSLTCTPLHWAASGGHEDAIEWLLSKGAKVNVTDKVGDTPLHKAAWRGHMSAVQMLVERGEADRSIRNKEGKLAVDLCKLDNSEMKKIAAPEQTAETTNPLQKAMEEAAEMEVTGREPELDLSEYLLDDDI